MAGQPSGPTFGTQLAAEYAQIVRMTNVGYELIFELATALLRAHLPETAHLLIVGAGGGMELQTLGPDNPHWRFTGVDPAAPMLAVAQEMADKHGLTDRVRLVPGTVDDLPLEATYEAATCIFVEHLLPDDGAKLRLLQSIAQRLHPGAAFLLVGPDPDTYEQFSSAGWQYRAARGMTEEQQTALSARVRADVPGVTDVRQRELLWEAGFRDIETFSQALWIKGWVAVRSSP